MILGIILMAFLKKGTMKKQTNKEILLLIFKIASKTPYTAMKPPTPDYHPPCTSSVLCFSGKLLLWGVAFAIESGLQFLYIITVIDRLPFTMLLLERAVKMVWKLPFIVSIHHTVSIA
ncbi:hypothetical protein L2E82_05698 [Cichorium intybus]|uniref:Uncharacterized protein n=1 Tax=Cichorium intybus TaxID=13427 RepID=A0ACB9H7X3_CICIN|nr:hypothetical protein L2E82_05698 [Cichorium intybus]